MDYRAQLYALLGDCVDLTITEPRIVFQGEWRLDPADPEKTLGEAAQCIIDGMLRHGCTRVNPVVRPTSRWLDVNCLFA